MTMMMQCIGGLKGKAYSQVLFVTDCHADRVDELAAAFQRGEFGMSVSADVQVLERERTDSKKLLDDG